MADLQESKKLLIRILLSIGLGIVLGLLFGDYCAVFRPIGDIYVMLLQSVVYPYLLASLIGGFGRMDGAQTVKMFKKGWAIYLVLILVTFAVLFVLIQGVPRAHSYIIPVGGIVGVWEQLQSSLFLFVPANPFQALVNNAVPAVVVISILYGLALQRFKNKAPYIDFCDCISKTSFQIWNWVIKIAPIGIFALIAYSAGTLSLSRIEGLGIYALLFFFGSLFLTFVLLPLVLRSFVPISYRDFIFGLQNAFIISLTTTLSVVAIPFIAKTVESLLAKRDLKGREGSEIIDNSLVISYPICQLGNCFTFLFIVAASAYFHQSLTFAETMMLSVASFFSSIGSPTATVNAVSFLTDLAHLPQSSVDLYVLLLPLTRYAQVLVSVTGMAFFTVGITLSYFNKLRFHIGYFSLALLAFVFLCGGAVFLAPGLQKLAQDSHPNLMSFSLEEDLKAGVKATFVSSTAKLQSQLFSLEEIQKRGVLRVGYNANMIPWCYRNDKDELVGYDVAFMYQLAKDINVGLEFIPFEWETLIGMMQQNNFDIAIGSIYVTDSRLEQVAFSQSYGSSVSSFIVRNEIASSFDQMAHVLQLKDWKVGVFIDPITLPIAQLNFPSSDIVEVHDYHDVFKNKEVGAVLWTKGHTDAWVTVHSGYTSISPKGLVQGWPQMLAYMLNKEALGFHSFLNDWLELKKAEGFAQKQQEKWILRNPPKSKAPRWSFLTYFDRD